jgi:arylsulfatase A-like enzyme
VPLVIKGPGVKRGVLSDFPARLMDVAPTVLTLLGIQPTNMDGVVLADALIAPTRAQENAQDALTPALTAYQRAIIARSQADVAAQHPPTHVGPRPLPHNPNSIAPTTTDG